MVFFPPFPPRSTERPVSTHYFHGAPPQTTGLTQTFFFISTPPSNSARHFGKLAFVKFFLTSPTNSTDAPSVRSLPPPPGPVKPSPEKEPRSPPPPFLSLHPYSSLLPTPPCPYCHVTRFFTPRFLGFPTCFIKTFLRRCILPCLVPLFPVCAIPHELSPGRQNRFRERPVCRQFPPTALS